MPEYKACPRPRVAPVNQRFTAAMAAVRWAGARTAISERAVTALFWLNLVLAAAAIWLSPAFGLYLFVGYYESGRFTARSTRVAGIVATALVIALAQVGGPRSLLFTPLVYAAFAAVNLAVTLLMLGLDRQRERLFVTLARTNDDLRAEQERSAALRDQLRPRLAAFKLPVRIWVVSEFPVTQGANGTKVQRAALRQMAAERLAAEG